jgi:hypothetical protein
VNPSPKRKAPDTQPASLRQGLSKGFDMRNLSTTKRHARKSVPATPDLFTWAQDNSRVTSPAVRTVMRRARVSAPVAAVICELSGFGQEVANV